MTCDTRHKHIVPTTLTTTPSPPPKKKRTHPQVSVPTANVAQTLERAEEKQKAELLVALLQEEMEQATRGGPEMPLTIVFVERKTRCDEVRDARVWVWGGRCGGERVCLKKNLKLAKALLSASTQPANSHET